MLYFIVIFTANYDTFRGQRRNSVHQTCAWPRDTPVFFELTVTVIQIANNWKEMNELTVTITVTQKILTTVTNCNSKVFVTTVTVTQKKSATQKTLVWPFQVC